MASAASPPPGAGEPRGRAAVEAALVDAAADLLAEVGPRHAGLREIARRAGVNHGQVHHYFGSKDALIRAAMAKLAADHYANATARAGGGAVPPPLTVGEDDRYWQAVIRLVLDGQLDIARAEVDQGISVPRRALEALAAAQGQDRPDIDLQAQVAASTALQLAWAALEEFVFAVLGVADDDRDAVRAGVAAIASGRTVADQE